jgi:hypothetical protein
MGGAGGTGGGNAGAGGASDPTPVDLNCTVNGAAVKISAADVISDFRQPTPIMYKVGVRGGTDWYAYGAEDATGGASTPGMGSNAFAIDTATAGPCNSGGSLKVSSPGNSGSTGWGVGFGINLMGDVAGAAMKDKFDAKAAGYTGIGYFMKCKAETDFLYFKTVDVPNDADVPNPVCSYSGSGTICNQYGQKNSTILTDWTYQKIYFSETLQDWDGGTITSGLKSDQLTAFQVQVNTQYTRDGSSRVANPFTCWIDDVHFLKDAAPSASVTPKTCSSGSAAPGGYYVTGNKIMDCKTGQQKIFHGVARPSFEWDRAGWNITHEDLARIAAMKANVVRFSLNQQFWLDSAKGGLYQAYVDRAVKWTLSLGMDVILDLHWLTTAGQTNMSDSTSNQFWSSVASKYKNEGRVIFELFNEPHDISAADWKSGMQSMYDAVRNTAGAQNLVLLGGLDWSYNLSQVLPAQALSGSNIAYVTHPYSFKGNSSSAWDGAFGNLAATYPIIATEFGQANTTPGGSLACDGSIYTSMLSYFQTKGIGWTGWAWYVDRGVADPNQTCGFPQLITSYSGATNAAGTAVKAAF